MTPYYQDDLVTIFHGDSNPFMREWLDVCGCLIWDPEWDTAPIRPSVPSGVPFSSLVFTDPRNLPRALGEWGTDPAWLFTWDCQNQWQTGPRRPVTRTKQCLWYGDLDSYNRDGSLWGAPPPDRDHPTTKQTALDGRRLTDLWSESLRWLHNSSAGGSGIVNARFGEARDGDPALRHAKPLGWMRCLIGNTSKGIVFDPFVGSGTSLVAAKDLGRRAVGFDWNERCCEVAAKRCAQECISWPADGGGS